MKISDQVARKYWLLAVQREIRGQYKKDGYSVKQGEKIGAYRADLVVRREDELIVFEFKSGTWNKAKSQKAKGLRAYVVHELHGSFRLIWVSPPREYDIVVDHLEEALVDYISNNLPGEIDSLSTHTLVSGIADLLVTRVHVGKKQISVAGEAAIEVELIYGSKSDEERGDGARASDTIPFDFEVILNSAFKVIEVLRLEVDTSSYYE